RQQKPYCRNVVYQCASGLDWWRQAGRNRIAKGTTRIRSRSAPGSKTECRSLKNGETKWLATQFAYGFFGSAWIRRCVYGCDGLRKTFSVERSEERRVGKGCRWGVERGG